MSTRRDFLKDALAGITVIGFMPSVLVSCSDNVTSPEQHGTITVDVAALDVEGKALRSSLPTGIQILIVRRPSNTYVTLQLICQHQGCSGDQLILQGQIIHCTCHESEYDFDGKVTQGPATKNLVTYATTYDAAKNEVTIEY
jgi:cytochrome b6-f complex iron-sulfur subunit